MHFSIHYTRSFFWFLGKIYSWEDTVSFIPTPSLFIMQIIILALLFGAANAVNCGTTGGSATCEAALLDVRAF